MQGRFDSEREEKAETGRRGQFIAQQVPDEDNLKIKILYMLKFDLHKRRCCLSTELPAAEQTVCFHTGRATLLPSGDGIIFVSTLKMSE